MIPRDRLGEDGGLQAPSFISDILEPIRAICYRLPQGGQKTEGGTPDQSSYKDLLKELMSYQSCFMHQECVDPLETFIIIIVEISLKLTEEDRLHHVKDLSCDHLLNGLSSKSSKSSKT